MEQQIKAMLHDKKFQNTINNLIELADLAISNAINKNDPRTIEFNHLSINFLKALKAKDFDLASEAGQKLIDAGYNIFK